MRFGIVILHYLTADDTIKCVDSIISNYNNQEYYIVIVDNYSNNGSIELIERYYKNNINIHILRNKENLGFANGNNVGYLFCKNKLNCNCIIVSNNDIVFEGNNIFERIKYDFVKNKCALIGPDIISLIDGGHQNPMEKFKMNKKGLIKEIIRYRLLYILNEINLYDKIKMIKKGVKDNLKKENELKEKLNVQLHGAFIIFTPIFVEKMDYAFCKDTFLYMEEIILKSICDKNDFITLYDPNIKVFHKEDSSTNVLCGKTKDKRKFVFKNMIKSYKVLFKYL